MLFSMKMHGNHHENLKRGKVEKNETPFRGGLGLTCAALPIISGSVWSHAAKRSGLTRSPPDRLYSTGPDESHAAKGPVSLSPHLGLRGSARPANWPSADAQAAPSHGPSREQVPHAGQTQVGAHHCLTTHQSKQSCCLQPPTMKKFSGALVMQFSFPMRLRFVDIDKKSANGVLHGIKK